VTSTALINNTATNATSGRPTTIDQCWSASYWPASIGDNLLRSQHDFSVSSYLFAIYVCNLVNSVVYFDQTRLRLCDAYVKKVLEVEYNENIEITLTFTFVRYTISTLLSSAAAKKTKKAVLHFQDFILVASSSLSASCP